MTRLFFDALQDPATMVKPQWGGLFASAQTGRDTQANGAAGLANTGTSTLTLDTPAATCIVGVGVFPNSTSVFSGTTGNPALIQFVRSGTVELVAWINASGFIEIHRTSAAGTLLGTTSGHAALALSTWAHVQIKVVLASASGGSVTVKVNNATVLTLTGVTTAGTSGSVTALGFGANSTGGASRMVIDDPYVCDAVDATATQGQPNNDFLGDVKVAVLRPAANGDTDSWTPSTGTNHAALVDESPPNTTDYVSSATSGQVDLFTLDDLPATAGGIYGVQTGIYAACDDAGAQSVKPLIKENSVQSEQTAIALSGTTFVARYGDALSVRPSDSALWTPADVNALQVGVKVA